MSKRFRAHLPRLPEVGERLRVQPQYIVEDWDLSTGYGKSYVPRRLSATAPRPGVVVRVVRDHATYADVMLDDAPSRMFTTGAILTVIGPIMLCSPRELRDLLDHVTFTRTLHTDEQRASVANQVTDWLVQTFPQFRPLRRFPTGDARRYPDFDTPAEWEAWLKGVEAVTTSHNFVPVPPFDVEVPPQSMPGTRPTLVRKDAIDRLIDRGRAN